jgi:PelA/Pel-15E family pectate lyase
MKKFVSFISLIISVCCINWFCCEGPQAWAAENSSSSVSWKQCRNRPMDWYGSKEAVRIADNLLLYHKHIGGWPKNIDMAQVLTSQQKKKLVDSQSSKKDATIDNSATYRQLSYLAKVYQKTGLERFKQACLKGFDFLIDIQYDNGGWPQFPYKRGYYSRITFNDGAMIGVMNFLKDASNDPLYDFVDQSRKKRAKQAVAKGIDCILRCQIVVDGKRLAWCAQHDEKTLKPAPARSYEKISLSGSESVGVVRFLMGINNPSDEIKESIKSAVEWFEAVKLTGIKEIRKPAPGTPKGFDKVIIQDDSATPLWARFYEIGTNRPIFCGRDGIIKYSVAEIEYERRNGYSWYTGSPRDLSDDYAEWLKQ